MIRITKINQDVKMPVYQTEKSGCFDIFANESVSILPHTWVGVMTGLRVKSVITEDDNYFVDILEIRPRSGLALKRGITVLNSPATIDEDYMGEILVILINHSDTTVAINRGDAIAQGLVISTPKTRLEIERKKDKRIGGFGSTSKVSEKTT